MSVKERPIPDIIPATNLAATGQEMHRLVEELYPICRSITGDGVRESLGILQRYIPLVVHEVPTGTEVFDWTVPNEWNIRTAWIKDPEGNTVVDFVDSSLHIVSYSIPIHATMPLADLKQHLHTIPEQPALIPYRTSYYRETWGFCLAQEMLDGLPDGDYEVYIDATLAPGHLTYGEFLLPGACEDEILISCHCCHPSLCNDNLSGMALATFLASALEQLPRRYSYRFLFLPGTIGAITWLSRNEDQANHIKHGLVVACVGDAGSMTYKRSRQGDAEIDRAATYVLASKEEPFEVLDFSPYGYDERQYCSPGFNLAVGSLTRTPHGRFPEYHTSADDPAFVNLVALADSLRTYLSVCDVLEHNRTYRNTNPKCEPQLGRRGLYGAFGGRPDAKASEMAMLWTLNYSDGMHSLLDIASLSGIEFAIIRDVARLLEDHALLEPARR